jgi:preprotein translocase subunit YajC
MIECPPLIFEPNLLTGVIMISISQLFISNAYAEGAAAPQDGNGIMQFLPLVALLAVFYFLILRPQQKRAKELKMMLDALQKGDEVATVGGILGKVTKVSEDSASIEIADNVVVQVQKAAIQNVLPKGTIKSA